MNAAAKLKHTLRLNLLLAAALCHCLVSCVSTGTGRQIKNGPMTVDLESKVLKQTGLSGTILGGLGGAAAGFGLGMLVVLADEAGGRTYSDEQRGRIVTATTIGGAVAGGMFGYKKGQQQGQRVVASAKEQNQLVSLVNGAREYNARLAAENQNLRNRVAGAKASKDSKQLAALKREAGANLADADARLRTRQIALEKVQPEHRGDYAGTLPKLQQEKAKLESTIKDIASTETIISL